MKESKILALGIPTCNRPELVIGSIERALAIGLYDQIIVSSNSHEEKLDTFINNLKRKEITYHKQDFNVGMSLNYAQVIKLCQCKYLHIVSDEDSINEKNVKDLRTRLTDIIDDPSVFVLSILNTDGSKYKDTSSKTNTSLNDVCGDTGHIGSSIINVGAWQQRHFVEMDLYCQRKGDVYPTSAAALISYSIGGTMDYFHSPIVEMGKPHHESEMGGLHIYRFEPRLIQFISFFSLIDSIQVKNKIKIYLYFFIFFSHHALCGAIRRVYSDDRPLNICKRMFINNNLSIKIKFAILILISAYYSFQFAYLFRDIWKWVKKI
jgi:hypothetical protein